MQFAAVKYDTCLMSVIHIETWNSVINNTKLTIFSISFATMSKCSTASPLMVFLLKSTFQKRSVWRVITFSVKKKCDTIFKNRWTKEWDHLFLLLLFSIYLVRSMNSGLLHSIGSFFSINQSICECVQCANQKIVIIYSKTNWDIRLWNLYRLSTKFNNFLSV